MATTPAALPTVPDAEWLRARLLRGETLLCEFKQQWHDLKQATGKGEFVKDVLALANTGTPTDPGYLIFGVGETASGPQVIPLTAEPAPETVFQILAEYTAPPVEVRHDGFDYEGKRVNILTVVAADARPHWASREVGNVRRDTVFLRRGTVVGIATMVEIETMIRKKDLRLGPAAPAAAEPIQAGFVALPESFNWRVVARVANVTAEPIAGVSVTLDVRFPAFPQVFNRRQTLVGATLYAGEAREVDVDLSQESIIVDGKRVNVHGNVHCRWMDLLLTVTYRDRRGFIQQFQHPLTLGG